MLATKNKFINKISVAFCFFLVYTIYIKKYYEEKMTKILVGRPYYIEKLNNLKHSPDLVKIVTGIRRCGKSKLFELFQTELLLEKVSDKQIININLEDPIEVNNIGLKINQKNCLVGYEILLKHILSKLQKNKMNYVFIDEIQLLEHWQQVANGLRLKENVDVYLTGSNAYMFSSDLANSFGGRYIEIKMQPYSFNEYYNALNTSPYSFTKRTKQDYDNFRNLNYIFEKYIKDSGFPQTVNPFWDRQMINDYLIDVVYNNTIQKDIVKRFNLENSETLNKVIIYLFDNIGSEISTVNIINSLKSAGHKTSSQTIDTCIKGLIDSYLLYECNRYNIKGKEILRTTPKYYVADVGLRAAVLGKVNIDMGHILENIVYLELVRKGYKVYVGKIDTIVKNKKTDKKERKTIEVDFVAQKPGSDIEYYQVALSVVDKTVLSRELNSLEKIDDNFQKFIISMDYGMDEYNGIKRLNFFDWLMETKK